MTPEEILFIHNNSTHNCHNHFPNFKCHRKNNLANDVSSLCQRNPSDTKPHACEKRTIAQISLRLGQDSLSADMCCRELRTHRRWSVFRTENLRSIYQLVATFSGRLR